MEVLCANGKIMNAKSCVLLSILGMLGYLSYHSGFATSGVQAVDYLFTTVDVPLGSFGTRVLGVNDNDDFVGNSGVMGFLFQSGKYFPISVEGSSFVQVTGINSSGMMVGSYSGSANQSRAFTHNGRTYTDIEPPAVTYTDPPVKSFSYGYGINDDGHVVGFYTDKLGAHGFLYDGEKHIKLEYPGSRDTRATGINSRNQIVGYYFDPKQKRFRGFIYKDEQFTTLDFPAPGTHHTRLQGINDRGDIVGYCSCGVNKAARGFLYRANRFADIQVPKSAETFPNGINNHGTVVGFYNGQDGGHGFYAVEKSR